LPETEREKEVRREPYETARGTRHPRLIAAKRGAIGEEMGGTRPWGWPESHRIAPAPLPRWLELGGKEQAPRFLEF
jgi:hypothetical protein